MDRRNHVRVSYFEYDILERISHDILRDTLPMTHTAPLGLAKGRVEPFKGQYIWLNYCAAYDKFVLGIDPENYPHCRLAYLDYDGSDLKKLLKDFDVERGTYINIEIIMKQRKEKKKGGNAG